MDETDLKILDCLTAKGKMTTTDIAKELFGPPDSKNLRRCDNIVRYHLKQMEKVGIVSCEIERSIAYWTKAPRLYSGEIKVNLGPFSYQGRAVYVSSDNLEYLILRD